MELTKVSEADYPAVVELANLAYRKTGEGASWNSENGIIAGSRLTEELLREDVAAKPYAVLLGYRDEPGGPLLGTVWLEPRGEGVWYLGLLTVRPDLQDRGLGKGILAAAEDFAKARQGVKMRMTVLHVRDRLIAWYLRRGYALTGETAPFPYGDDRFGRPMVEGLYFVVLEKTLAS
jgi:GNAT superfamily N-acetyltransferase